MTELKCGVDNCFYNKSDCCCKGEIIVEGHSAECTSETCCGSFQAKKDCTCSNATEHPTLTIQVDCDAVTCVYNEDRKCNADKIGIAGRGACKCADTECATFRSRV